MNKQSLAIVLFSGGLDSIITAKLLKQLSISVKCIHFYSPFFGIKDVSQWKDLYDLDIISEDVSECFASMLKNGPEFGFGKTLNPCVDCKILLLKKAHEFLKNNNGTFLATGEVIGQRPMSQRKDTMYLIPKKANVSDILIRPLSAKHLNPTKFELERIIDRNKLLDIFGRGRKRQLELAKEYRLKNIPTPAGGCRLTEKENAKRFWPVLKYTQAKANDFYLSNLGRQFWFIDKKPFWLTIGRNEIDNNKISNIALNNDLILSLHNINGPIALARDGKSWSTNIIKSAASLVASYAPKAVNLNCEIIINLFNNNNEKQSEIYILPHRSTDWLSPTWEEVYADIHNH